MDLVAAQQLALDLMSEHGLADEGWRFAWSNAKLQIGCAQIRRKRNPRTGHVEKIKTIKLSRNLVSLNEEDEVRDTILHEIAHAIAGLEHGHDEVWKTVCRHIGARPMRLAGAEVKASAARFVIVCCECQSILGRRHRRINMERLKQSPCIHCGPQSKGSLTLRDTMVSAPQPDVEPIEEPTYINVFFNDLTEEKQREILAAGFDPSAPNCSGWPLAIIPITLIICGDSNGTHHPLQPEIERSKHCRSTPRR